MWIGNYKIKKAPFLRNEGILDKSMNFRSINMLVVPFCHNISSIWKQQTWNRHTHKVSTVTLVRMRAER